MVEWSGLHGSRWSIWRLSGVHLSPSGLQCTLDTFGWVFCQKSTWTPGGLHINWWSPPGVHLESMGEGKVLELPNQVQFPKKERTKSVAHLTYLLSVTYLHLCNII